MYICAQIYTGVHLFWYILFVFLFPSYKSIKDIFNHTDHYNTTEKNIININIYLHDTSIVFQTYDEFFLPNVCDHEQHQCG